MAVVKIIKDFLIKGLNGPKSVPAGLLELYEYSKNFGSLNFYFNQENGSIIATSKNFHYGSIITSGRNLAELDKNIKDAILTSFEIPSSYAKEAKISRVGEKHSEYALA